MLFLHNSVKSSLTHPEKLQELFIKYLDNNSSPEERTQLAEYFGSDENEDIIRYLIQNELKKELSNGLSEIEVTAASDEVKTALLNKINDLKSAKKIPSQWYSWIRIAAVILLLSFPAVAIIRSWNKVIANFDPIKIARVTTGRGQRKTVQLPDGSRVWVAPLTSFIYPEKFRGGTREVKLIGEAFFEVAKDKMHPFIIHTGEMNTRVVGTSFMIRAPLNFIKADVTVVTGIVKVSANKTKSGIKTTVTLTPKQRAVFSTLSNTFEHVNYPEANLLLKRKDGILIYHDSSIKQIIDDLSNYYNVKINVDTQSLKCLCSGEFDTNQPLNIAIEQLCVATGAKSTVIKGSYQIKGGGE